MIVMKRNNMKKRLCMALCALFSAQSKNADAGYRYDFGEHLYKIVARKDDELTDLEMNFTMKKAIVIYQRVKR